MGLTHKCHNGCSLIAFRAKRVVPTSNEAFLGNSTALQCLHSLQSGDANPLTNFIISVSDLATVTRLLHAVLN